MLADMARSQATTPPPGGHVRTRVPASHCGLVQRRWAKAVPAGGRRARGLELRRRCDDAFWCRLDIVSVHRTPIAAVMDAPERPACLRQTLLNMF